MNDHFGRLLSTLREWVLVAGGSRRTARLNVVGLAASAGEAERGPFGFLDGLVARGLASPVLVVSDAPRGLLTAIEALFPATFPQGCVIRRHRRRTATLYSCEGTTGSVPVIRRCVKIPSVLAALP